MKRHFFTAFAWALATAPVWANGPIIHPEVQSTEPLLFRVSDGPAELKVVELSLSEDDEGEAAPGAVVGVAADVVLYHIEAPDEEPQRSGADCGVKGPSHERRIPKPGDRDRSECPPYRYGMDPNERAGHPYDVAPWAAPSMNPHYEACWVGGGAAIGGRSRTANEGTWGLDFAGWVPRKIWSKWGDQHDGGEGAYATDHIGLLE